MPRALAIVDRWTDGGFGFAVQPYPIVVYFVQAHDLCFDPKLMHTGLTIEFTPEAPNRPHKTARLTSPGRPEAREVTIAKEPLATQIETTVRFIDVDAGNGRLDNPAGERVIYFPFRRGEAPARVGDRVRAWVFEAQKGLRAVGVERIA